MAKFVVFMPEWYAPNAVNLAIEVEADEVAWLSSAIDGMGEEYTIISMIEMGQSVVAALSKDQVQNLVDSFKTDPFTEMEDKLEVGVFVGAIAFALVAGTAAALWIGSRAVRTIAGR